MLPYASPSENKTFALLEVISFETLPDLIQSVDSYPYNWSTTILVDPFLGILRIPGKQTGPWDGIFSTMESDIEQTRCSFLRYSRSLTLALVKFGMASVGLDVHSGKYCGRYNIVGTGSFSYKGFPFELRKVKGFQMYAISGEGIYFIDDVDTLQCFDNHLDVFSNFPELNLTFDEPMRKDLTLYQKINISFFSANFSPVPYTDVRKRYPAWRVIKFVIVVVMVCAVIRSLAFETLWLA